MDQKEFDQVVATFKDHCAKWPENVEGMCNALRHKMTSTDHGVSHDAAEQAMKDAMDGKFVKEAKK